MSAITEHRIPGCTSRYCQDDELCNVVLADIANPGASLIVEVEAAPAKGVELLVWEGEDGRNLLRSTDPTEARAFAEKLRTLAAAIDKAAGLLATPPAGVAKPEPIDYAARFAALDSDVLFDVEEGADEDAAARYVESLLIVLTEWRTRVMGLLAETPAEWAVPEVAEYQRALNRTREAWLQWNFRYQGGPDLPWPFDLPESAPKGTQIVGTPVARIVSAGRRSLMVREVAA